MSRQLSNITAQHNFSILVVDDDDGMRYGLVRELKKCGCSVSECESVESALTELSSTRYDFVFCDMRFPGGKDGEELLAAVTAEYPNLRVVLLSCAMESTQKTKLMSQGAALCLRKPLFEDRCFKVLEELSGNIDQKVA